MDCSFLESQTWQRGTIFGAHEVCKATLPCHEVCQIATKPLYIGLCTHKLTKCWWAKKAFRAHKNQILPFYPPLSFWSFIEIIEHHHTAVMLRNVFKCPRCLGCICRGKNPCQHLAWQTRIVGPSAECFTSLRKAYAVLQAQRLGERIS